MRTIVKIIVALVLATIMAVGLIMLGANDNAVISVFAFGGVGLCLLLGVFDVKERGTHYESIRHRSGLQDAA